MKKLTLVLITLFSFTMTFAQTEQQTIANRKKDANRPAKELTAKAIKVARKEAKTLAKEGWIVPPGAVPIAKQLDKSYKMYYEYESNGLPKYIISSSSSVGSTYDAARMKAINNAKIEIAGLIETEVTSLTEDTLSNNQITQEEATSISNAVQASKTLVAQKLGRIIPVVDCYRAVGDGNVEAHIRLAYNSIMALEAAKEVIQAELKNKGKDLHEQLDKMWDNLK